MLEMFLLFKIFLDIKVHNFKTLSKKNFLSSGDAKIKVNVFKSFKKRSIRITSAGHKFKYCFRNSAIAELNIQNDRET